jgi:hypothetical protein
VSGVLTPLGIVSVGAALPGMVTLESLAATAQALAAAELTGKLSGAVSVSAALVLPPPPQLKAVGAFQVAAQLALNPQISSPSLQVAGNAQLIAELQLKLSGLVLPDFGLGAAGVAAYKYQGTIDELGAKVTANTSDGLPGGSGSDVGYAVLLVATAPAAVEALKNLLIH